MGLSILSPTVSGATHLPYPDNRGLVNQIPSECLIHIFSYLNLGDLIESRKVCRQWTKLLDNDALMGPVFFYKALGFHEKLEGFGWKETFRIRKQFFHHLLVSNE